MSIALNKRERILALATAAIAGAVLLYFLGAALLAPHKTLKAQYDRAVADLERKQNRVNNGMRAIEQLDAWRAQSLPSNPETALSLYQNWLLQTARDAGLSAIAIDAVPGRRRPGIFHALRFGLQATASLDDLTTFLHRFYQAGHLHQILAMGIVPETRGTRLSLQITIEALSLPTADRTDALADAPPSHELAAPDVYRKAIGERNLFAAYEPPPPPTPPRTAEAAAPTPTPPPPPPRFDPAKHAYLTAIVAVGDRQQAWIFARTSDETFKLFEGDTFEIGGAGGKVLRIGQRDVEIEFDGRQYLLALGENLRSPVSP